MDDYRPIHHADRMRLKGNSGNPIDPKLEEKNDNSRLLIERGANINVNSAVRIIHLLTWLLMKEIWKWLNYLLITEQMLIIINHYNSLHRKVI